MASMEIGEEALEGFSAGKDLKDVELEALAQAALYVLLGLEREDTALVGQLFEEMDVDLIKKMYSSLVCLFVEAAKYDLSHKEFLSFLRNECGFSEDKGELLCRVFLERKKDLRGLLTRSGNHSSLPQLSGVDWRLDYFVPTSEDRAARQHVYHVSFKTKTTEEGGDGKVEFACSVEQLQDLIFRLKDACKSVERAVERR